MQQRGTLAADGLTGYLTACGGSDTFALWTADGQPDLVEARALAERLRAQLGDRLGHAVTVEQSFNRVIVSLVLETAKV